MLYTIQSVEKKVPWEAITPIEITSYPWGEAYMPKTQVWLYFIEDKGYMLKMRCEEKESRALYTEGDDPVYKDSCLEFFANYYPHEEDTGYINFEINSNGAVLCAYGYPEDRISLKSKGYSIPQPKVVKNDIYWEIELFIPKTFIQDVYGKSYMCSHIKGNFFKCGDDTHTPHFGCWSPVVHPTPMFHKPEYFGDIVIEV